MSLPQHKPASYDDLLQVPDHKVAEILGGDLYVSPRPASAHARTGAALVSDLGGPFDRGRGGPGGWWILYEPELHLGGDVLVPDLAGWRRSRMPTYPKVPFFELRPDWVCEILSPSTARVDRLLKMPRYAQEGVEHAWLIDPSVKLVEVYVLDKGKWVLDGVYGDDQVVKVPPFEAVPLDLWPLWGEERPSTDSAPSSTEEES